MALVLLEGKGVKGGLAGLAHCRCLSASLSLQLFALNLSPILPSTPFSLHVWFPSAFFMGGTNDSM